MPDTSPNENTPLETTGRTIARITPAKVPAGTAGTGHGEDRDPGSRKNSAIEDPRSIIRQGLAVILLFFGVLGAWAYWGEISGAVVAPGKIKVESERKTVQHLEGGIVDTILVREGQDVAEGQVLVELESVQVDASENMLQKQLVAQWAAHSRALAEKSFSDELVWPDGLVELARTVNSADVLDNEQKIFQARKEALRGQLSLLETQIAQLQAQVSGFEDQVRAETTIIGTLNEELRAKRQLYKERYLEKSQILELERNLASHMGERGRLRQAIAETKQRDAELRLRMEDLRNRFVEEATSEAGKLENDIIQTRERIRPLRDAKKTPAGQGPCQRQGGRPQGPLPRRCRPAGRAPDGHRAPRYPAHRGDPCPHQQDHRSLHRAGRPGAAGCLRYAHRPPHPGQGDLYLGRPPGGQDRRRDHALLSLLCGHRPPGPEGCQALPFARHARHGVHHHQEAHGALLHVRAPAQKLGSRPAGVTGHALPPGGPLQGPPLPLPARCGAPRLPAGLRPACPVLVRAAPGPFSGASRGGRPLPHPAGRAGLQGGASGA